MTNRPISPATDVEVDVRALFASLWRALPYLIVFILIVAAGTFVLLGQIAPQYRSETTVLIESGESDLTRSATTDAGAGGTILDEQAITSQVQLIRSRDLGRIVASRLKLENLPEFDPALGTGSLLTGLLSNFGLAKNPTDSSVEERVLENYYNKLQVYNVEKSRVIAIDFVSTDPKLAADAANAVAEEYLALQRSAKRDTTEDATKWLESEISDLRAKVKDAEAKVEDFRASNDLFSSGGGAAPETTLPEQQLGDVNAELTRARTAKGDADAKAEQIRAALKNGVTPNMTDVLNSQLIQRLVEQEVALRSTLAQLSATLLPEHPRIKELQAQIADIDTQINREAKKILDATDADAKLAQARVDEIQSNLGQLKTTAATANDAGVQLRALEREAAADRDLLDTYLHRYRDAIGRQNGDYLPADARIISRASVAIEPDYPKKVPMTAAATVAAFLLAIAFILIRELASGRPMRTVAFGEPLPLVPAAVPIDGHMRWADDHSVRRMMRSEPTLVPDLVDRVEESLSTIAAEIMSANKKRILVTLADGAETNGRPLAALSLARAIARTETRAVLVDLRGDGANSASLGEGADLPGFADLFAGEASFAQVIFRDRQSRVHFIAGGRGPLPVEEFVDERLGTILNALDHTYDFVVLDAPNEMIATIAPTASVVVVVSEFGAADPRTIRAFDRITAVSSANILLLVVDPATAAAPQGPAAAHAETAAGEAA